MKPVPIPVPRDAVQARTHADEFAAAAPGRFNVRAEAQRAEIELYDQIGMFGVTASAFRDALGRIDAPAITLRINSPGGDVFDGIAIYNDLVAHPAHVTAEITGLAASAASLIAMAADRISIAENGFMMIHNAWGLVVGDRHDMTKMAGTMALIDDALAATYARRTGLDQAKAAGLMDAETWYAGTEAVEAGFADDTLGEAADLSALARFGFTSFSNAPEALRAAVATPSGLPPRPDWETRMTELARRPAAMAVGPGGAVEVDPDDVDRFREVCANEWRRQPALRAEFRDFEGYAAWRRADAKGLAKTLSGQVKRYTNEGGR